jgi:hypothetical protein
VSYNWYGSSGGKQDGGHGDADGQAAVACVACHDLSQPPPGDLHGNGTYESIWANGALSTPRNANTAHLKAEWFVRSAPPTIRTSAGDWEIQVNFDFYCTEKCHTSAGVAQMNHEGSEPTDTPPHPTVPSDGKYKSCEFGTYMTYVNGDARPYPIDVDLNTGAAGGTDFALCISCHDPHGTTITEPSKVRTYMMRDQWITPPAALCGSRCHN